MNDLMEKRLPFPEWVLVFAVIAGFIAVFTFFLLEDRAERNAHEFLLQRVNQLSVDYRVEINGRPVDRGDLIIASFKSLGHIDAHHSGPTAPIRIRVVDRTAATDIVIARDSDHRDEYWGYRPGRNLHNDPLGDYAGRIVDARLTEYLHRLGL